MNVLTRAYAEPFYGRGAGVGGIAERRVEVAVDRDGTHRRRHFERFAHLKEATELKGLCLRSRRSALEVLI